MIDNSPDLESEGCLGTPAATFFLETYDPDMKVVVRDADDQSKVIRRATGSRIADWLAVYDAIGF